MNDRISLGGCPMTEFGVGGVFRYEGLRLPGLDGPSNLIIAASKPPPPQPQPDPPQATQDFDDGDLGLGGFNVFHIIGAPVRLAGHALAPIARAADKTGIPQWTNRHLIKPIIEPALKAVALGYLTVESAGIHSLLNIFVPSPAKEFLHGLVSVAADIIKRGIEGRPQAPPQEIADTMLRALTPLIGPAAGSATQAVFDALWELHPAAHEVAPDIAYLIANWSGPPGKKPLSAKTQGELQGAKAFNNGQLNPFVSSTIKLIADLATTGKVRKSDLQGIVGNGQVLNKILDLFGIHNEPPADVLVNIAKVPPAMQPAMQKAASAAVFAAATGGNATTAANMVLAAHPTTQHLVSEPVQRPVPPAPPVQRPAPPREHRHVQPPGAPPLPTPPMSGDYAPYPAVTS